MNIDDVVRRIRDHPGDEAAWSEFYKHFAKQVLGTLYMLGVADAAARDDLTSDVFLRFVRYSPWREDWRQLPGARVISQYLRITTYNAWRTTATRDVRIRDVESVILPPPGLEGLTARLDLESYLDTLTGSDRVLFSRYFIEGDKLAVIAEEQEISYANAATRLSRLREKLLRFLR